MPKVVILDLHILLRYLLMLYINYIKIWKIYLMLLEYDTSNIY